jgi:hypothetical protein
METLRPYEMSILTKTTRRNIPEDGILYNHRRENLKSYIALTAWAMEMYCVSCEVRTGFYTEDDILRNHCRENLKSYLSLLFAYQTFEPIYRMSGILI